MQDFSGGDFKRNNKCNYDFPIKSGIGFKEADYRLSKRMLEEEVFPPSFEITTIQQIYKGKGRKEVLGNIRYRRP